MPHSVDRNGRPLVEGAQVLVAGKPATVKRLVPSLCAAFCAISDADYLVPLSYIERIA